jgi:hypothetical protein
MELVHTSLIRCVRHSVSIGPLNCFVQDGRITCVGYNEEARAAFRRGETDVVERLSRQELSRARGSSDAAAEVDALCMLARVALRGGDVPAAGRLAVEARTVADGTGEMRLEQGPLHLLAGCAGMSGDLESARVLFGESIALNTLLGDSRMVVVEQNNLAYIELHAGNVDGARGLFTAARQQTLLLGFDDMVPCIALAAAVMTAADGDDRHGARLLGAAGAAFRAARQIPDPDDALEQEALRDRLVSALGHSTFEAEYAEGATLDVLRTLAR